MCNIFIIYIKRKDGSKRYISIRTAAPLFYIGSKSSAVFIRHTTTAGELLLMVSTAWCLRSTPLMCQAIRILYTIINDHNIHKYIYGFGSQPSLLVERLKKALRVQAHHCQISYMCKGHRKETKMPFNISACYLSAIKCYIRPILILRGLLLRSEREHEEERRSARRSLRSTCYPIAIKGSAYYSNFEMRTPSSILL